MRVPWAVGTCTAWLAQVRVHRVISRAPQVGYFARIQTPNTQCPSFGTPTWVLLHCCAWAFWAVWLIAWLFCALFRLITFTWTFWWPQFLCCHCSGTWAPLHMRPLQSPPEYRTSALNNYYYTPKHHHYHTHTHQTEIKHKPSFFVLKTETVIWCYAVLPKINH